MRIKGKKANINYDKTIHFFQHRAGKYNENNPYGVTMYQDGNEGLVNKRNQIEIETLLPLLQLNEQSQVLDIACGVGRWADAIITKIDSYLGIDFSDNLIKIAVNRNNKPNFKFQTASIKQLNNIVDFTKINRIIVAGILAYLNDSDVREMFETLNHACERGTILCLREPLGIDIRLSLIDHYSEDLKSEYNAIYRSKNEIETIFQECMTKFTIINHGPLFKSDTSLNNRKETAQYFYILEKQ